RHQENGRQGDEHIGGEKDHGGAEILFVHHPSVQLDHVDRPGMDDLPDLPADGPQEQQHPGALDGAAGGAGAGADEHEQHQDRLGELRPQVKVRAGEAGGGDDGGHLEGGVADAVPGRAHHAVNIEGDQHGTGRHHNQEELQLVAAQGLADLAAENQEVHREVHVEEQHEHGAGDLDGGAAVGGYGDVLDGEAAGAGDGEGVDHAVKP